MLLRKRIMINADELLFVVDEENTPLEPLPRSTVHQQELWHRTSHIWVKNNKNEILCQKRSMHKDISPGNWEPFFGGHILAQETALTNCINELYEELGLLISAAAINQLIIWKDEVYKEYQFIHRVSWSGTLEELKVEKEEIDQIKWVPLEKVLDIIKSEDSYWSLPGYFPLILEKLRSL